MIRPILFSSDMVKAILNGTKTQTRRVIKGLTDRHDTWDDWASINPDGHGGWIAWSLPTTDEETRLCYPNGGGFLCPYGQPGDLLWVREAWTPVSWTPTIEQARGSLIIYRATPSSTWKPEGVFNGVKWEDAWAWRPSIHMPRWASRITLEVTDIRAERIQDISHDDCCRETGAPLEWPGPGPEPYTRNMHAVFSHLWDSINAKRGFPWATNSWDSNPWVWVVGFRRVEQAALEGAN